MRALCLGVMCIAAAQVAPSQRSASDEQTAFATARAQTETGHRIDALTAYLRQFPSGAHRRAAQTLLLDTLLEDATDHVLEVRGVAEATLAEVPPGIERWSEEARLSEKLAAAGEHGVDLNDAHRWASDAVAVMTVAGYRAQMLVLRRRYRLPALPKAQLDAQFARDRSEGLLALAHVEVDQGHLEAAHKLLAEAQHLQPVSAGAARVEALLALAEKQDETALRALLRANALAPLPSSLRSREKSLFEQLRHGDERALEQEIDAAYRAAYPVPYALRPRELPAGGHPVLLELFTGSDCGPCAGPDLAVDSLLSTYGRKDLIALAYDEHIPRPDPLATPQTVARAAVYGVEATPAVYLDGDPAGVADGSREDVENLVFGFADQLEQLAALPSDLHLHLAATRSTTGKVEASVALERQEPATAKGSAARSLTTGDTSLRTLARAVVFVALVQDNLRYTGENGVRLHRMVVRSLQQVPVSACMGGSPKRGSTLSFDLPAIQSDLHRYLDDYQTNNDRFGSFHFPPVDLALDPTQLAVVAFVQDPVTRRVLQSAFAIPAPAK